MTVEATTPIPWDVVSALFPTAEAFGTWLEDKDHQTAASDTFERDGHMVTVQRGPGGRFGRGSRLGDTMHAVAGVDDDDEADGVEFAGGRIDWGTRLADGAYQLDFEDTTDRDDPDDDDGDEDDDDDDEEEYEDDDYRGLARLRLSHSDMKRFAAGLSASLLVHQMQTSTIGDDDPNRPLIAALVASTPMQLTFENEWADQSVYWGMLNADGSARILANDDDGDQASITLSLAELRRLHAQLVRQNMEEEDNPYTKRAQTAAVEIIEREGHRIAVNRGAKGQFSKMSAVAKALEDSANAADSLASFDRPALMREAKRRNLDIARGAPADRVREAIISHARENDTGQSSPAGFARRLAAAQANPTPLSPALLQVRENSLKKMNVPALKALAKGEGHSFTSKTKKADLVEMLMAQHRAAADPSPAAADDGSAARALEEKARARQAAIDAAQPRAAFLADLEEALGNDTPIADLRRMTNQALRIRGVAGDPHAEGLAGVVATSIDTGEIRRALNAVTSAQGLRRLDAGDGFDPAEHTPVGKLAPGDPIELVRPGYTTDINGETVRLSRPTVAAAPSQRETDAEEVRQRLRAAQAAEDAAGDPESAAARRARRAQHDAKADLERLGVRLDIDGNVAPAARPSATPAEQVADLDRRIGELDAKMRQPTTSGSARDRMASKIETLRQERAALAPAAPTRDKAVRRRAAARRAGGDSPMRALSGSNLTAALEGVTADDEQTVRAGLDGRDLAELVQIARDVPTVQMPPRQNRTALVDSIVRGTVGFRANARAMGSGMSPTMQRAMQERAPNGLVEGSPQTLEALERLGMVQKSPSGLYRATPHGIKSASPAPTLPAAPSADDMSRAVGQGLTRMMEQAAGEEKINRALDRYRAEGDLNAVARAEKIMAQHKRGLFIPEDVDEVLADLDDSRTQSMEPVPETRSRPRPLTSRLNAHSLRRGDQFIGGNGETVTVVGHQQGVVDGTPVQYLDVQDRHGNTTRLVLGLNQPVDRLTGMGGGGGGTFALETHEVFCLTPRVHPGPCKGWKDDLPDGDPRKTGKAKAKKPPKGGKAAPRLAAADIAALPDDALFDLFADLSKQDTLDEPLMRRLIEDMDRRERATPIAALEDSDLTPEQKRVDELVAGGRDYLSAYAEVHGGDESGAGAATVDRQPGERLDKAVRRSYDEFTHLAYLQAEKATRGHMLNKAGQVAGVNPLTLFTGPISRARRYASEDLQRWWASNGRMNLAQFKAQVTGGERDKAAAAKTRQQSNSRDFI